MTIPFTKAHGAGNDTRCAATLPIDSGRAQNEVVITTGTGPKHLKLIERNSRHEAQNCPWYRNLQA